jgi:hypothetical protein
VIMWSLSRLKGGERRSSVIGQRHKGVFLTLKWCQAPGSVRCNARGVRVKAERVCGSSNYWSATTNANNSNNAWNVNFNNGNVNNDNKNNNNHARAVRPCL